MSTYKPSSFGVLLSCKHMVWSLSITICSCSGRKKAALTYVATYTFGCFTKHWNNFHILLVGRIFCGVATSLLYSAFESWLVAEHFKVICSPQSAYLHIACW